MDYTEIYRCIKKMLYAQGIDESFLERLKHYFMMNLEISSI